jgi:hypothetical protein
MGHAPADRGGCPVNRPAATPYDGGTPDPWAGSA